MKRIQIFVTCAMTAMLLCLLPTFCVSSDLPQVDPWSTYVGGGDEDFGRGVVVDTNGDIIVAGSTSSTDLPATSGLQTSNAGGEDAFVARYTPDGMLVWMTYFGGSGGETEIHIALNTSGKCTIAGTTGSSSLPGTSGSFQPSCAGGSDAFLAQFASDGTLLWSTFYGGKKTEQMATLATDTNGDIYLVLNSGSRGMPCTAGVFLIAGSLNIVKFSESGTMQWATQHGDGTPWGRITTDGQNNLLIGGIAGDGFPVSSGAWQSSCAGGNDGFILKYSSAGARIWSTYYGGSGNEWVRGTATDGNNNVLIAGYTISTDLPVSANAFQTSYAGGAFDAFVAAFSSAGSHVWSTYLGGDGSDACYAITSDAAGVVTIGGRSSSSDLPVTAGAFQSTLLGSGDGMLAQFSPSGSLNWCSYVGGTGEDGISALTAAAAGAVCLAGTSFSTDFPVLNASQPAFAGGGSDACLARFTSAGTLPGYNIPPVAMATADPAQGTAPLEVSFSSAQSYDPDGSIVAWSWIFGDGGSSTLANPTHTFDDADVYTVQLTVTDDDGATASTTLTITATAAGGSYLYVASQDVSRVNVVRNKYKGVDVVLIQDNNAQPVAGALVTASYSGQNEGVTEGTTDAYGYVTLETKTSVVLYCCNWWCFTITGVQKSGYDFNTQASVLTACEGAAKAVRPAPVALQVEVWPNPFNPSTLLRYDLPHDAVVQLRVSDLLGRDVALLVDGWQQAGMHTVRFDASGLAGGIYYYRLVADGTAVTGSMMLVK